MLSFFRNRKKKEYLLQNWHIPVEASYELIDNGDSIQYVNEDESRILYFSKLSIDGNKALSSELFAQTTPSIKFSENGWECKGTKQGGNEILVCVFSFTNEEDKEYMNDLFTSINYTGK